MNALVSRDAVKAWLGLTSGADDAVLDSSIGAVSQAVLADIGRTLLPAIYTETFASGETPVLRHWPVTQVLACTIDGLAVSLASSPGAAGWWLEPADAAPPGRPQVFTCRGGRCVTVTYRAGYEILAEPALVPAVAPYVVSAQAPFGAWLADTGVGGASGAYQASAGVYTFDAASAGQAIGLSYAYVPADLVQAALEWVADRYAARSRIGQSAKTLGGQETTSFIVKAMPDVVNRLLQPYRRVV